MITHGGKRTVMEQITSRSEILKKALVRLNESLELFAEEDKSSRIYTQLLDSVIQRFEFCVDIFWKCLKDYLKIKHGIEIASPKSSLRESINQKMITLEEFKTLDKMIDDRNDASHRYDEVMSEEITFRAKKYYVLMRLVCSRLPEL